MSVLDSRSDATADTDPTGVGARKARRSEEEQTIFVVAYYYGCGGNYLVTNGRVITMGITDNYLPQF